MPSFYTGDVCILLISYSELRIVYLRSGFCFTSVLVSVMLNTNILLLQFSPPFPIPKPFHGNSVLQVCLRSGLPCPPPGDFPDPGIEPTSLVFPAMAVGFFTTRTTFEVPLLTKALENLQVSLPHLDDGALKPSWACYSDSLNSWICWNTLSIDLWWNLENYDKEKKKSPSAGLDTQSILFTVGKYPYSFRSSSHVCVWYRNRISDVSLSGEDIYLHKRQG